MPLRTFRRFALAAIAPLVLWFDSADAQVITTAPQSQTVAIGGTATLSVTATGTAPLAYQWKMNGANITGAKSATLALPNVQPANAGIYTVTITSGTSTSGTTSPPVVLGVTTTSKLVGPGQEFPDIVHPVTRNTYDQILLGGPAASMTADPGQILRVSFIDLTDDIVQIEFSGAGTLTLLLDSPSGPATPVKYNQPSVNYMKGQARIVIAGANETTNLSVFSVGTLINPNPSLYQSGTTYDGLADIASISILSPNGKFAGLRSANASYFATRGLTGIFAPGVQFSGPVFVENINAFDTAIPVLLLGAAADTRITGGDLLQANAQPIQVSGLTQLRFANGTTSHSVPIPAQSVGGTFVQNGVDITTQISGARPAAALYTTVLRPEGSASPSLGSGLATLVVNASGSASVSISFSNLTSTETGAHLRIAPSGDFVLNFALGQVSDRTWTFAPTGTYTSSDLIYALNTGNIYVGLDSANFPSGELRGTFVSTTGSQVFVAPPAPPALPDGALTNPTATDAARFLTQATFGPTTSTINALMARGIPSWIDDQLALPVTGALAALRADLAAYPLPPMPAVMGSERFAWNYNWYASWWKIAATAPDQLRHRVAFALSEILVLGQQDDLDFNLESKVKYYDILVNGAFGSYRQLLENVTLNPAMGLWLSHRGNAKANPTKGTAPDENYAREVQQLFSIGLVQLQPDGTLMLDATGQPIPTYSQATISETAKVFTGWAYAGYPATTTNEGQFSSFYPPGTASYPARLADTHAWLVPMSYYDNFHDKTAKRLVSLQQVPLANATPTLLPAGQSGPQDLATTLDTLVNHPNTGPFISKLLIQRLVTSNPSPGYVYRVARVFANDGTGARGNLGAVVRAILTDYEARSPALLRNFGYGKIKEPVLRMTALLRALNVAAPNGRYLDSYFGDPRASNGYTPVGFMPNPASNFGQGPLWSATVFNFFSPTYSPAGAMAAAGLVAPELEITDSNYSITVPNQLIQLMERNVDILPQPATGASPFLVFDYSALLPNARISAALLDQLNLLFCANQLTTATRTQIIATLAALPAAATDLERIQTAIQFTVTAPDGALQK